MGAVASVRVKCSGFTSQPNNKAYDDVLNCNRNHHSRKKSIKKCSFYIETIIQVHEFFFRSSRWDGEKKRAESALVWGEMVAFSRDNYFRWSDGEEMRRLTCVSRLVLVLFWSFREHFACCNGIGLSSLGNSALTTRNVWRKEISRHAFVHAKAILRDTGLIANWSGGAFFLLAFAVFAFNRCH